MRRKINVSLNYLPKFERMPSDTETCIVCSTSGLSKRYCVSVFGVKAYSSSGQSLVTLISKLLKKEITKDPAVNQVICKKCHELILELEELQNRVAEIKCEILEHNNSEDDKSDKQDDENDSNRLMERTKREIILSKKLLYMPSSDEESNQVSQDDIEMKLVEMHGAISNSQIIEHVGETIDMEDTEEMHDFSADEGGEILDSGAVEHSSDSDYEPHKKFASVNVPTLCENSMEPVKIKAEPTTTDESVNHAPVTMDKKPNILKRKIPIQVNIQKTEDEEEDKKLDDSVALPIVTKEGNLFTCLLCQGDETVAGEAKAITAHVKEAHGLRLYICDVCGQDFHKRNHLSAHLDEHVAAEEGDFQCEICNRIFSNLRLFRIHRRMHYPQNKAWECETCGKKYSSKNLLEEHVNTHLGVRPYVCNICGKDFASKYTYKAHEKTHESRPRPFKCEQCNKSFLSQQNLTQHERTHLGMKEYACHLCAKQFGSAHNLEVHSIVHTGYKPFVCSICSKAFARKAEIRDHERTHTGERPYQCEFCGATFSQRSNLQSHKRATHYDDKRYQCTICGKGFKRRRLLDYHVKAAHTGERPFKCEVCEATFVYPEHFKKHRRIHTGEKPFLCEVCGKAFNSRDNRNAHRFVHSDKKPYECLVCGAGFMRKPLLYQHMQAQGHLNDTIVVNQPRLTTDDDQLVTVNSQGEMEIVDATQDSKFYIHDPDGNEHIIIDGQQISFTEVASDEENEEVIEEIEQVVEDQQDIDYEEIISSDVLENGETQIIDTPDGPVQLVKVRIPNENGEEEEAWIKIVPE
ncbi:hypothetical protein JTB14_006242 [Gonioctena quinquepunctata]|nr:hypothetical protein JTB14_006242 [Gonioctena quinquepunctata]